MDPLMKKIVLFLALLLASAGAHAQLPSPSTYYTAPTVAALKALTTRPMVVEIVDANPGIFNWSTTPCSAADDIFQITPTSGPAGCYTRAATPYAVGKSTTFNGLLVTGPTGTPLVKPGLPYRTPEQQDATAGTGADDTAAFAAIFAAGYNVKTTPGKTYRLNGLSLNGNTIDCGGLGGLQAGTGGGQSRLITGNATTPAGPAIIMKGWGSQLLGCGLGDPNDYSLISTTLSAPALAAATSVVVTSAANLAVGRLLFITLDNGIVWPVKIASFSGGGTTVNFTSGDTLPSAAASGNAVRTASGVVRIDSSPSSGVTPNSTMFTQIRDSVFNGQPMAMELVNTDANPVGNSAFNKQGTISNVWTFYTKLVPLWMSNDVEGYQFSNVQLYGYFPNNAAVGMIQDSRGSVVAYGGHTFNNVLSIQSMADFILKAANLSLYNNLVSDSPNGILVSQTSQWLQFNNVFTAAQSGTSGAPTPLGGYGLKVTDSSVQISISNLQQYTGGSATNLWIDSGSIVRLDTPTWGGNRSVGGTGTYTADLGVATATSLNAVTIAAGQISGTATNDNATAGKIGEFTSCTVTAGAAVALTTATVANVCSLSLTAGDWDVWGMIGFAGNAATNVTWAGGTFETSNSAFNNSTTGVASIPYTGTPFAVTNYFNLAIPVRRISLSGTQTQYLNAYSTFSVNTNYAYGGMFARRVR